MKFLKTKTTIFEIVSENENVYHVKAKKDSENVYSKSKNDSDIVKVADTIDKLIDMCLVVGTKTGAIYYALPYEMRSLYELRKSLDIKDQDFYGAIKIKGENNEPIIKSVAKMDAEGVMRLI